MSDVHGCANCPKDIEKYYYYREDGRFGIWIYCSKECGEAHGRVLASLEAERLRKIADNYIERGWVKPLIERGA